MERLFNDNIQLLPKPHHQIIAFGMVAGRWGLIHPFNPPSSTNEHAIDYNKSTRQMASATASASQNTKQPIQVNVCKICKILSSQEGGGVERYSIFYCYGG